MTRRCFSGDAVAWTLRGILSVMKRSGVTLIAGVLAGALSLASVPVAAQPPVPPVPGIDLSALPGPAGEAGQPPRGLPAIPGDPQAPPPPPSPGAPALQEDIQQMRDELDRMMREDAEAANRIEFPEGWPDLTPDYSRAPIRSVVQPIDRALRIFLAPLSVTTVQLAPDEVIIDCVIGDGVFFEVQCGDNLVYIKARVDRRRTRLTVSTLSDRLYAYDLFAVEEFPPDHILRVHWDVEFAGGDPFASGPSEPAGPPLPRLGEREPSFGASPLRIEFESAASVAAVRAEIEAAERELLAISEQAAEEVVRMQILRDERLSDFLGVYPRRIEPRYRLTPEIQSAPIHVSQIWTDGRFTYVRSHGEELPALYEITGVEGDEELLINYQVSPEGLYVINHVVDAGYAQLHGSRGEWHVWEVPPLSVINESVDLGFPDLPPDWRRTRSRRSWFVRHDKLTKFIAIAGGAYVGIGFINGRDSGGFCWKLFC